MADLAEHIRQRIALGNEELATLTQAFHSRALRRGALLVAPGQICRELAFIESGYMRLYDLADGKEITLWLGGPDSFVTALSSFMHQQPSRWYLQAVTPCQLQVLTYEAHMTLLQQRTRWLEFDNQLLAQAYALLEDRLFSHLHSSAQERYHALLQRDPALFNQVPLQYIASMLGIAPETLSRLRRQDQQQHS
jgi:CRP-like cAMP-binding protein